MLSGVVAPVDIAARERQLAADSSRDSRIAQGLWALPHVSSHAGNSSPRRRAIVIGYDAGVVITVHIVLIV